MDLLPRPRGSEAVPPGGRHGDMPAAPEPRPVRRIKITGVWSPRGKVWYYELTCPDCGPDPIRVNSGLWSYLFRKAERHIRCVSL